MKKLILLLLFIPLVSCDDSKKADKEEKTETVEKTEKEEKAERSNSKDFVFNGLLQGTQLGYYLKDKYGDDLIINGKRVPIPSVEHKFLFQKDFKVSLKQTSDEGLIVNYEGTYDIVRDDTDILEIECQLSDGDMSNPKMTIEYSKINKSYTFKAKDGSPNFKLFKFLNPDKLKSFIPQNLSNSDNDLYKTVDILKKLEGYWISERELNDCFETKTGISIYFENKNTYKDFTRFDNWYFSGYEDNNIITDVSISGKSIIIYVIGENYDTGELYENSYLIENYDFLNNKRFYEDGYRGQMIKMKDADGNFINGIERSENGYGCEYNSKTDNQISEILTDENINIEDWPMYYVKSEGGLNVRNKAGNDGKKIATLIQNELVYLISETDEILVINDFDEKTGVTNKVEGRWVKIKTYSPPKLKGDKIPWEDNKENVVGYVFNGFLDILDTDIDSHLRKLLK